MRIKVKLFILLIVLTAAACTEDVPLNVKVANNLGLSSITTTGWKAYRINFSKDKPVGIQYSGGSHDEFEYRSGVIHKWLSFDRDNQLIITVIYGYDTKGRITNIAVHPSKPPLQGDTLTNTTTYTDSQIISTWRSRQGLHKQSIMTLDELGEITRDEVSYADGTGYSSAYMYSDGNLVSCQVSNSRNSDVEFRSFTYLNTKNEYYNYYKKFLFGDAWRNNSAIDFPDGNLDIFFPPFSQSVYPQVSQQLVSTYSLDNVSATVSYEFDTDGNLKKQVEEFAFADGRKWEAVTSFEYEYGL